MRNFKLSVISAFALGLLSQVAFANCTGVPELLISDGNWLFRVNGLWQPIGGLNSALADGRSRNVPFIYVARDPDGAREGIVVIKTGTRAADGAEDKVELERSFGQRCNDNRMFPGGKVRGRSYDAYHDYSYGVEREDQRTLEAFHLSYPVRAGRCKLSNDDTPDSYFAFRWQSNRSQFSFDRSVVRGGQFSQFVAQFGPSPAIASTLTARRVEVKYYATRNNNVACVSFAAPVRPGAFIRVIDLEHRTGLFSRARTILGMAASVAHGKQPNDWQPSGRAYQD